MLLLFFVCCKVVVVVVVGDGDRKHSEINATVVVTVIKQKANAAR